MLTLTMPAESSFRKRTFQFMESEKERATAEQEHQARAAEFSVAQRKLQFQQKDMPRSISRSQPYFQLKDHLETRLQVCKLCYTVHVYSIRSSEVFSFIYIYKAPNVGKYVSRH